jgi:hypothetical protein
MAVSLVSTPDLSGYTFYRNKGFDISFSVADTGGLDTSLYFSNSTPNLWSSTSNGHFLSPTGFNAVGAYGTLSVDVLSSNPRIVSAATAQSYIAANGICTDPSGIVYFVVTNQNKVFQLDLSGTVTTFAGTGVLGDSNGDRLTTAQFRTPAGIATDGSGTFYVTDQYRVRKIDPSGAVTTLAGSVTRGIADGVGASATFYSASTVVIRPNGDLLVSDDDSHCIRNVTLPGAVVTTYAGIPLSAGFADGSRNYVPVTTKWNTLRAPIGGVLYDTSDGAATWTSNAYTLSIGNVYASTYNPSTGAILYGGDGGTIERQSNVYSSVLSGGVSLDYVYALAVDSGLSLAGGLSYYTPNPAIFYSGDDGGVWYAGTADSNVLSTCYTIARGGGLWMAGGIGSNNGAVNSTSNLLISYDGVSWLRTDACPIVTIYGLAYGNGRWIAVGSREGTSGYSNAAYSTDDGATWTAMATPGTGRCIAYGDGKWVVGYSNVAVNPIGYSTDGSSFLSGSGVPFAFTDVQAVAYSPGLGRWVASGSGGSSNLMTSTNGTSWSVGTNTASVAYSLLDISYTTPSNVGAQFAFPHGLLYDPSGTLYIADQYNNRIRAVANGSDTVTTYAGTGGVSISNGTLTTAGLARPSSLARDPSSGTIYVGSFERNTLQTILGSNVSLLAGAEFAVGYVNGPPASARFSGLSALATFGNTLYMTEVYNGDVRKLTTFPDVRPGVNKPPGYTIIATSNYPITVSSRIDLSWTSVGGSLPLYKFEPFNNVFRAKVPGDTLTYSTSSTELIGYLTGTGTSTAAFRATGGATVAYPYTLTLAIQDLSGTTVVDDVSTSVTINASRLLVTPCNTSFTFYRNEPIAPITFTISAFPASNVYSGSSLPTGLTFTRTDSNAFALTGIPLTQTLASNYLILGQDTSGRSYTTQVSLVVNPERLVIDVTGTQSTRNVLSTTPITPVTLTSRFPPYTSEHAMSYTWSRPPPEGLVFTDCNGIVLTGNTYRPNSFQDPSFSLTLSGTITEAQVRRIASNGPNPYTISVVGARTFPLPSLSPSVPTVLSLTMGRVILFDTCFSTPFVGIPVSNWWYSAKSYFETDVSIDSIVVSDGFLPDGITSTFSPTLQRLTLTGTPTAPASYAFTLTATSRVTPGLPTQTATLPVSITTLQDSITIYPTADVCSTFIQTRDVSLSKAGVYTPIEYTAYATSSSSNVVTMTATGLPDGVSIVSLGSNKFALRGRPTTAVGLTDASLTATALISGATATKRIQYSVSAERFTFTVDPSANLTLAQNVTASPVQIVATTFSDNPILRYSSANLPPALTITNAGLISGVPEGSVDASFRVVASTAYTSGFTDVSYTITDDAVLLQPSVYTTVTAPGGNVSIPITGYSLSALTVSNYRFSSAFPYGLSINPTTGLLSGTLASSLPADVPFTLLGSAGIVDGSLTGLLRTDNLTVSRAQLIEIQGPGNLRVYYSDDLGFTWSNASSNTGLVAARVGANNIDTYLIPTSSDTVLRSTTGSNYTSVPLGQSAYAPLMTGIAYKPGSSTWWTGGTISNGGGRAVYVFKTLNDGLTWDAGTTPGAVTDRSSNATPGPSVYNAYLYGGVDLAYRDGVLLLGGGTGVVRSVDDGASWTEVLSGLGEVGRFSLDQGLVWIAVGSSQYPSRNDNTYTTDAVTSVYSLDQGLTWTPADSGFNMNAYEVLYANGAWFASGLDWTGTEFVGRIRYSFDGVNWPILSAIPSVTYATTLDVRPPGMLGVIGYDEGNWKLLRATDDGGRTLYSHPGDTPLDSDWTTTDLGPQFPDYGDTPARFSSYTVQTIDPGADVTTLSFPLPNTGPTFVSPAQSTYVVWQYMPIPPIVFSAPGATGYFISALPVGLTWNAATRTVSGAAMRTGTQTFTVYAKNSGITAFTVTLLVEVPRVIRKQTSAGAYTSLVRQYTEVNAAQNARDTRALPSESRTLGEFASPYPPSVVTPSNCPC